MPCVRQAAQHQSPRPRSVLQTDHQHLPLGTDPEAGGPERAGGPRGIARQEVQDPVELGHSVEVNPGACNGFQRPDEHAGAIFL